jgi:hypothetical protein
VPDPADFLDHENWTGSSITLAIQLGSPTEPHADRRARRALQAVWAHPSLDGCYRDGRTAPDDQERVPPVPSTLDEAQPFHGLAILPDGQRVVCSTYVARGTYRDGCDWLVLSLPSGALARAGVQADYLPTVPPAERRYWNEYMDAWFVPLAEAVQRQAGFRLAVLGEEAPISAPWLPDGPFPLDGQLPPERATGYVLPTPTGVEYHGPTSR